MGFGDELLAAGHAQAVYDQDPSKRVAICNVVDRVRWDDLWTGNPIIASPQEVAAGEPVHRIKNAVGCRPYLKYPFSHATGWRFTNWRARDHRGKLYLTEAELDAGARFARVLSPFVLIEPSPIAASNPNKAWPPASFERLIAMSSDLTFVQLAHREMRPIFGIVPVPTRSFRESCAVLRYASAYVGPEGALHHAAAILGVPAVVIFGGCASVSTTGYPEQLNLADSGRETPCGRWLPCEHCARAMRAITPEIVSEALSAVLDRSPA